MNSHRLAKAAIPISAATMSPARTPGVVAAFTTSRIAPIRRSVRQARPNSNLRLKSMILLYVRYEESYDRWLPDVDNTYQLQTWAPHPKDGQPFFLQMSNYASKDAIKKDYPQVEHAAYLQDNGPVFIKDGQAYSTKDKGWMFTDDDFLKVVSLPLIAGTTLTQPQTAAIAQSEAIQRYGTDQVIGRTLTVISRGIKRDFKINGVFKDVPKNSSMRPASWLRRRRFRRCRQPPRKRYGSHSRTIPT